MTEHRSTYDCLTDPTDNGIPMAMGAGDPGEGGTGARATCTICGRDWVLIGRYGFVYWTPAANEPEVRR